MKFFTAAVMVILAAIAQAKVEFTNSEYSVVPGQPFTLTWSGAVGAVTIALVSGPNSNALSTVATLISDDLSTTYTYTFPTSLPSGTYAFTITDGSGDGPNYSGPFSVSTGITASPTTSSTMPTMTTMTTTSKSSSMMTSTTSSSSSSSSTSSSSSSSSSTTSSMSSTSSASSTAATSTTIVVVPAPTVTNTSGAERFSSPFALVLGVVAAIAYFN